MMQSEFRSVSEAKAGETWRRLFDRSWPAYRAWLEAKGATHRPDLETSVAAFRRHMPEMVPLFERLGALAGADDVARRFLTLYRPPAYITGCSQAVWTNPPQLTRNYDYHPHLQEGVLLHSAWHGRQVMAVSDCLWGVVDGMNEDGLAVSLTFGGRKVVGDGFGIPIILRYVLEFCSDVAQAVAALESVPSHMAYNVMVLDRTGAHRLVQMAPDRDTVVLERAASTNHQGSIDWPEHAAFSATVERETFLISALDAADQTADTLADVFLTPPLYNRRYSDGFGTLYTSVYRPADGWMELRWPDQRVRQSFAAFAEGLTAVTYEEAALAPPVAATEAERVPASDADYWVEYGKAWAAGGPERIAPYVADALVKALGLAGQREAQKTVDRLTRDTDRRGQVPWEILADVWASMGSR